MEPFIKLEGVAAPLNMINVDTDMIIPKQYLKTIQRTGLGKALFDEMRFNPDGSEKPDFVLNKPAYRKAVILVAGDNFGCGSSREHAPWALLDFGIRCVVSTSFADIFYNNCINNGLLPITLGEADVAALLADAAQGLVFTIDLQNRTISCGGVVRTFEIEFAIRDKLLAGLDMIGETLARAEDIAAIEGKLERAMPWQPHIKREVVC